MYDPIVEPYPNPHQGYPSSYWAETIPPQPANETLQTSVQADVAIIGAGYTGMSAAYHIQKHYKKSVVIVDANQPGWGCSGRNAGFVLPGTGRLSLLDMEKKWGPEVAKQVFAEFMQSIDLVENMIQTGNIDCDKTPGGYLKLAHRRSKVAALRMQGEKLEDDFGDSVRFVPSQEVRREFINCANMYGGLYFDKCFGVNPLKLALGYLNMAKESGTKVYSNSPVIDWQERSDGQRLITPDGEILANKVIIATNGYTGTNLHQMVKQRHFPVMSSIIVTRALTEEELQAIQIRPGLMTMDSRLKKYYYRLLPDNRLLFGGRGAIDGKRASDLINKLRLQAGLNETFPSLQGIKVDNFWSGWVSASYDKYPRIGSNQDNSVYYAMGYCGSGLAFSSLAGKRIAQLMHEPQSVPSLPFWQSHLPKFPLPSFRRLGLRAYYAWANLKS